MADAPCWCLQHVWGSVQQHEVWTEEWEVTNTPST